MGIVQPLQFQPGQADWESWMTTMSVWASNIDNITQQLPLTANQIGGYVYPVTDAERKLGLTGLILTYSSGDPRRYGAKGDGTTDDYQALQTAINVAGFDNLVIVSLPGLTFAIGHSLSMRSGVTIQGVGYTSVIQWINGFNTQDNMLKFESITYASVERVRLNGNRLNVNNSQYGCYFGSAKYCRVLDCYTHSFNGDGIHCFNSNFITISRNFSFDNVFHGVEVEKSSNVVVSDNQLINNLSNGIYVFLGLINNPGDQNFGCHNVTISGNTCSVNNIYGIAVQGQYCYSISIVGNNVLSNGSYGINIFDRVSCCVVSNNNISYNGGYGIYLYRSWCNRVSGNCCRNNSQSLNAGFSEIFLDGDHVGDPTAYYSLNNIIESNMILMDGFNITGGPTTVKGAYGIKENDVNQGPNIIRGNLVTNNAGALPTGAGGTAGSIAYLFENVLGSPFSPNSFSLGRGNVGRIDENRGIATFNGNGTQTVFVIPHGLKPDEPRTTLVNAGSPDAAAQNFSLASDFTNLTVTFVTAPRAGTGNVILRWYAAV